ncbi:MAG: hypothetical protein ACOX5Z_09555 [Desulfobulbus sp.]
MKLWPATGWRVGLCCAWLVICGATAADAGGFRTNLVLGVLQVYDDNVLFAYDDLTGGEPKLSDFITTISPGLEVEYERGKLNGTLSVRHDIAHYFEYDDLNSVDQSYQGTLSYSPNELSFLNLNAGYKRIFSTDSDLQTSGVLLDNTERRRQTYGAQLRRLLSETLMTTLSYDYMRDDYASNRYTDSEVNSFSLGLQKEVDWLPEGYVYASAGCMLYRTASTRQRNESLLLGGGFRLTEGISINLDAGVRKMRSKYDAWELEWVAWPFLYTVTPVRRTEEEWGQVAHGRIQYEGEMTTASLGFGYDVQPSGGQGTLTERTQVQFNVERRLTEDWRVRGFSSYFLNYREGYQGRYAQDKTTLNAGFELSCEINRYLTIRGRYLRTWAEDDRTGREADRNRFLLQLTGEYELFQ